MVQYEEAIFVRTINILNIFMFYMVSNMGFRPSLGLKQCKLQNWRSKLGPAWPPSQKPLDAVWQPVADTTNRFYVYSAFVERRKRSAVRVIGATTAAANDKVFCRLWLRDNRTFILEAEVQAIKESHEQYHGAAFVLCLLRNLKPDEAVGGSVAVVSLTAPRRLATNLLKVVDTTPKTGSELNIHVCVRPLHEAYNNVEWMLEWIEINRLLGASHFYLYNMSIGKAIDCLLKDYQNQENLITLLPFKLPLFDIWAEGQLAAMHDCLYRSVSKADWLLIIDLDEVVVPHSQGVKILQQNVGRNVKPFPAMFDKLAIAEDSDPFAFVFRNAFFYQGWKDDPESPAPLFTSRKTRRTRSILWYGIRSKYAVRPSKVIELGIHRVQQFESGIVSYNSFNVDSEIALLHHYRGECIETKCNEEYQSTVDRAAHRWAKQLWERVQQKQKDIDQLCS